MLKKSKTYLSYLHISILFWVVSLVLWVSWVSVSFTKANLTLISGPLSNAPIDTIKTRIQRSSAPGSGFERFKTVTSDIMRKEGFLAFYKGLTPRLLRVAPGQAVTFMVYEKVKGLLDKFTEKVKEGEITTKLN